MKVVTWLIPPIVIVLAVLVGLNWDRLAWTGAVEETPTADANDQSTETESGTAEKSLTSVPFQGEKVMKTEAEWREQLTPEQYYVTREKGTERAFTGEHWDNEAHGTYTCVCCEQPLFHSATKYESGTGWPSFYEPVATEVIAEKVDRKFFFMPRTEVLCSRCDSHLGHVFPDGPQPTGLRYCLNSAALDFLPNDNAGPDAAE